MKNKVKRTVLLLLVAVILFSGSMVIARGGNDVILGLMRGAGLGLALAAAISAVTAIVEYFKG